ncbi:hypothetical protein BJ912DRAFT_1141439 [Pholiota molesta]|nr:hypothetical protein BJ912DRAFT_1141439 [Pholiota molesta]
MDNTAWSRSFYADSCPSMQQRWDMPLPFVPNYHQLSDQTYPDRPEAPARRRCRSGSHKKVGMGSPSLEVPRYEAAPGAFASQTYVHPNHDIRGTQSMGYGHSPSLEVPRYEVAPVVFTPQTYTHPNPGPFDGSVKMDTVPEVLFNDPDPKFWASIAPHPHSPVANVEETFPPADQWFFGRGHGLYQAPAHSVPRSTGAFATPPANPYWHSAVDVRYTQPDNSFDSAPDSRVKQVTTTSNNRYYEEAIVHHKVKADTIAGPSTSARSSNLACWSESRGRGVHEQHQGKGKGKRKMVDDALDALPPNTEHVRRAKRGRPSKQDALSNVGGARSGEKDAPKKRARQRKTADSSLPKRKPPRAPKAGVPRPNNEAPPAVEEAPKPVPPKPVEYTPVQVHDQTIPTDTVLTTT